MKKKKRSYRVFQTKRPKQKTPQITNRQMAYLKKKGSVDRSLDLLFDPNT